MTRIDTDRTHSSTLTAQIADWLSYWGTKGYASKASAVRALTKKGILADIEKEGLAGHFAFVTIEEGKHAGRVVPTLGFELGADFPPFAMLFAHRGITVSQARP